jgi:molybdopterin synthase catalytic subunit
MDARSLAILDGPLPAAHLSPGALLGPDCGAACSFLGVVRHEHHGKAVTRLFYECHRPLAEAQLATIAAALEANHGPLRLHISHGTGWLLPGQAAVAIHVLAAHRVAAFAACREAIEAIKRDLPVWKRECYADGSEAWLAGS